MKEDLNRHIPQKINEFASLALAGRYPSNSKCFVHRIIYIAIQVSRDNLAYQ